MDNLQSITCHQDCGNGHCGHDDHDHSHGRVCHPFEENSHRGLCVEVEMESGRYGVVSVFHQMHVHGLFQCQTAKKQRVVCGPTTAIITSVLASLKLSLLCVGILTSIFRRSSRPMRLLCISWYASSASRRLSYSTKANLLPCQRY